MSYAALARLCYSSRQSLAVLGGVVWGLGGGIEEREMIRLGLWE